MVGGNPLGIGVVVSPGLVLEDDVHLVVLEAPERADSEAELRAEVDGGVDGFEGAHEEDDTAFLERDVEAKVLRQGWCKVRSGAGLRGPACVCLVDGRSLEKSDGGRYGVCEDAHPR